MCFARVQIVWKVRFREIFGQELQSTSFHDLKTNHQNYKFIKKTASKCSYKTYFYIKFPSTNQKLFLQLNRLKNQINFPFLSMISIKTLVFLSYSILSLIDVENLLPETLKILLFSIAKLTNWIEIQVAKKKIYFGKEKSWSSTLKIKKKFCARKFSMQISLTSNKSYLNKYEKVWYSRFSVK